MPTDPMTMTDEDLTRLRDAQFLKTAEVLKAATEYFSDSVVDPVTAACDAAGTLNFLVYDSDRRGLAAWIAETDSGLPAYCSEGLCDELLAFLPEED